jgi:hypothetical protein
MQLSFGIFFGGIPGLKSETWGTLREVFRALYMCKIDEVA